MHNIYIYIYIYIYVFFADTGSTLQDRAWGPRAPSFTVPRRAKDKPPQEPNPHDSDEDSTIISRTVISEKPLIG